MFNPSREEARRLFFDAWRKYREGLPLVGIETMAVDIVLAHPEYHPTLDTPERYLTRDYAPEAGETNPFLHMSIHLAIDEQLSIDQPAGLRARFARLCARHGDTHAAQHEMMDCLAETLWQAQRAGAMPDAQVYLDCLDAKLRGA